MSDKIDLGTPIVLRMRNDQEGPQPFKARLLCLPVKPS